MTTENTDIETLAAEDAPLTLVSGMPVKVERLRTRALMALLKILTRGAADFLPKLAFGEDTSTEAFTGQLLAGMVLAIPEAEDETVEFIQRMVSPAGLHTGLRLTKAEIEENADLEIELREQLDDPDLEDLFTVVTKIVEVEAPHILALGKRLGVLLQAQQKSAVAKQGASSKRSSRK